MLILVHFAARAEIAGTEHPVLTSPKIVLLRRRRFNPQNDLYGWSAEIWERDWPK